MSWKPLVCSLICCLLLKRQTTENVVKSLKGHTNACLVVKIIIVTHEHFRLKTHAGRFRGQKPMDPELQWVGRPPTQYPIPLESWVSSSGLQLALVFTLEMASPESFSALSGLLICPHIFYSCPNNGVSTTLVFGNRLQSCLMFCAFTGR